MTGFKKFLHEYGYTDVGLFQAHGDARDAMESLGLNPDQYDKAIDSAAKLASKISTGLNKIDKILGFKKSILLAIPTYKAKINFLTAVYNLSRHPKKIAYWQEVFSSLVELSKLGLMNPIVAVPAALSVAHSAGMKENDAFVVATSKLLSTTYFYLETLANVMKNSSNEKLRDAASTVAQILLPKSEIKH